MAPQLTTDAMIEELAKRGFSVLPNAEAALDAAKLTRSERAVLEALQRAKGRTVSHDFLLDAAESDAFPQTVAVWITSIRKKLKVIAAPFAIQTTPGLGYRLEVAR